MEDKIAVTHRIPTSQFAYIEFTQKHENVEEAMDEHKRVASLYTSESQLTKGEWVAVRNRMLVDGNVDVNLLDRMSTAERWWINQTKLALRAHEPEEPIIN